MKYNVNFNDKVLLKVYTSDCTISFTTYSIFNGQSSAYLLPVNLVSRWFYTDTGEPFMYQNNSGFIKLVKIDDTVRVCITWIDAVGSKVTGYQDDFRVPALRFSLALMAFRTTVSLVGYLQPKEHNPHIVLSASAARALRQLRIAGDRGEYHAAVNAISRRFNCWSNCDIRISSPYIGCFSFVCVNHDNTEQLAGMLLIRKDSRIGKDSRWHPVYKYVMRV